MLNLLRAGRSLIAVLLVCVSFVLLSPVLRLVVIPGAFLFPSRRFRLVSWFMKLASRTFLAALRLSGARSTRVGELPTDEPILVVANHQSLVDILQVTLLSRPCVPAFVTRSRYRRFVPLVSACVRLLECPFVDPVRDPQGAIDAIRRAARELPHGLLIFPEGHRSRDGRILPFRTRGLEAILAERRLPVYLLLNDGADSVNRFDHLLFGAHRIDAYSEVIGRFEPPSDPAEWPEFVRMLRTKLVDRIEERRRSAPAA